MLTTRKNGCLNMVKKWNAYLDNALGLLIRGGIRKQEANNCISDWRCLLMSEDKDLPNYAVLYVNRINARRLLAREIEQ